MKIVTDAKTTRMKILMCFCMTFMSACGGAFNLEPLKDEEAIQQIRKEYGYPRLSVGYFVWKKIYRNHQFESPLNDKMSELMRKGAIQVKEYGSAYGSTSCIVAPEYKHRIQHCKYYGPNPFVPPWDVSIYSHSVDVTQIVDKLVDSKAGTAVVKYETRAIATPIFNEFMALKPERFQGLGENAIEPEVREARFRKWDQGWRIEAR